MPAKPTADVNINTSPPVPLTPLRSWPPASNMRWRRHSRFKPQFEVPGPACTAPDVLIDLPASIADWGLATKGEILAFYLVTTVTDLGLCLGS